MPKGKPQPPRSLPVEGGRPLPGAPGPPRGTGGGIVPADPICDGVTNDPLDPVAGVIRPFCACSCALTKRFRPLLWTQFQEFNFLFTHCSLKVHRCMQTDSHWQRQAVMGHTGSYAILTSSLKVIYCTSLQSEQAYLCGEPIGCVGVASRRHGGLDWRERVVEGRAAVVARRPAAGRHHGICRGPLHCEGRGSLRMGADDA